MTTLSTSFWRQYGYRACPTALAAQQYFPLNDWEVTIDLLTQFLQYAQALFLLSGVNGVGKSSLIKHFISLHSDADILYTNAQTNQTLANFIATIATRYLAVQAESISSIEQLIENLQLDQHPKMLIIDDAEQLPLDVRNACLQIIQQQSTQHTFLPIVLVGETVIEQQFSNLLTKQTAERYLQIVRLLPMSEKQTHHYIEYLIQLSQQPQLVSVDADLITQNASGVVANINQLFEQQLAKQQVSTSQKVPTSKMIWWAMMLVLIVASLVLYRYLVHPRPLSTTIKKPPAYNVSETQVGPLIVDDHSHVTTTKPTINHSDNAPIKINNNETQTHNLQQQTRPHPLTNNQWHDYTIQLTALSSHEDAVKFINEYALNDKTRILSMQHNGKTFYVVTLGNFTDRPHAQLAIKQLPAPIARLKPWPRTFISIRESK